MKTNLQVLAVSDAKQFAAGDRIVTQALAGLSEQLVIVFVVNDYLGGTLVVRPLTRRERVSDFFVWGWPGNAWRWTKRACFKVLDAIGARVGA